VVKPDGSLWGLGYNWPSDPIGDGTTNRHPYLVRIGADSDWLDVAAGTGFAVVLKRDGSLWTWGRNDTGQLGDGTTQMRNRPVRIGTDCDWVHIAVGGARAFALKSNGTLWAWGANGSGQLGIGTTQDQRRPVRVGRGWESVSAGLLHTVALKTDGSLWAWGSNLNGILGNGSTGSSEDPNSANESRPAKIGKDTDWVAVSAGNNHSLALKADGTLWAWGASFNGQLGNGTKGRSFAPEKIGTANDWKMANAGANHTVAVKRDGSLWAWGFNGRGQVGDGTTEDQLVPVRVGAADDWIGVWGGIFCSVALKTDGSLWTWGGELLSTGAERLSPDALQVGPVRLPASSEDVITLLRPEAPPTAHLKGKLLPDLAPLGLTSEQYPAETPLLLVLVDPDQRPSRRALKLLGERAAAIREKGVAVQVISVGAMSEDALKAWKEQSRPAFPLSWLKEGAEKARITWGATALPWFILTDKTRRVADEGFSLEELEAKLKGVSK
jgi:alpha-tubulin suppressor-like RCC1 family protein